MSLPPSAESLPCAIVAVLYVLLSEVCIQRLGICHFPPQLTDLNVIVIVRENRVTEHIFSLAPEVSYPINCRTAPIALSSDGPCPCPFTLQDFVETLQLIAKTKVDEDVGVVEEEPGF